MNLVRQCSSRESRSHTRTPLAVVVEAAVAAVAAEAEAGAAAAGVEAAVAGDAQSTAFMPFLQALSSGTWPVPLDSVAMWLRETIFAPHPELARGMVVCPYAEGALARSTLLVSHARIQSVGVDKRPLLVEELRAQIGAFDAASESEPFWMCLIVTVEGVVPHEYRHVLNGAYRDLKVEALRRGMMIGAFHPLSTRTSRHSSTFFPLRSPVPLFAIRRMIEADARSLAESDEFLAIHRERFGDVAQYESADSHPPTDK